MRTLEQQWNKQKIVDDTFAARPTKVKMPEDYARNIRSAVTQGLLDPESDVTDAQLLFACACGTMLGFRGNKVCGGLSIFYVLVVVENHSLHSSVARRQVWQHLCSATLLGKLLARPIEQDAIVLFFSSFHRAAVLVDHHVKTPGCSSHHEVAILWPTPGRN